MGYPSPKLLLMEGELEEHLRAPVAEIFGAAHTTLNIED